MTRIKNISPLGDLWLPTLALLVPAGGEIDLADNDAVALLEQAGVWGSIPPNAPQLPPAVPIPADVLDNPNNDGVPPDNTNPIPAA